MVMWCITCSAKTATFGDLVCTIGGVRITSQDEELKCFSICRALACNFLHTLECLQSDIFIH